jgi:hypothetical protein
MAVDVPDELYGLLPLESFVPPNDSEPMTFTFQDQRLTNTYMSNHTLLKDTDGLTHSDCIGICGAHPLVILFSPT